MTFMRGSALSRMGALGLLAALAALTWAAIIQPTIDWWLAARDTSSEQTEELHHLALVAGRRAGIEASLRELDAALSNPAIFWPGQSVPAVSAAIQGRLREIVTASGGTLRSTTDLPAAPDRGLPRVSLRLQSDGPVTALQAMLSAIEMSKPVLFVDAMTINAPDGSTALNQPPMLSIQIDVIGYRRTP